MFSYEYKLSCGTEHADSPEAAKQYLIGLALNLGFDGGTVLDGTGFWKSSDRGIVTEPSLILILSTGDYYRSGSARLLASRYCEWSGEDCVLLQITDPTSGKTTSEFVTGAN